MAASLREQILLRVVAVLQAAAASTGVAPGSITRSREVSISRAVVPAIVVMPESTDTSGLAKRADRHEFEFKLELFVRGDPWESLADPIDVAAHAAICSDAALAALWADLRRIGESFEAQEADRTAGTLTVRYRCTYLTDRLAIDRAPPF